MTFRVEGGPLLIMMGEKDESMSIPACREFQKRPAGHGQVDVELKVYDRCRPRLGQSISLSNSRKVLLSCAIASLHWTH